MAEVEAPQAPVGDEQVAQRLRPRVGGRPVVVRQVQTGQAPVVVQGVQ